jgi:hypothetical protein
LFINYKYRYLRKITKTRTRSISAETDVFLFFRAGKITACAEFWWGNLRERDHLEDSGVDGRIMLRWIFRNWDVGIWTGSSWLWIGTIGGHL